MDTSANSNNSHAGRDYNPGMSAGFLHRLTCPMCGGEITAGAIRCATCGELRPGFTTGGDRIPRPASVLDIVIGVLIGTLAILITLPGSFLVTTSAPDAVSVLLMAVWNSLVWVLPVTAFIYWWRRGVVQQYPDQSYLWRVYYKSQAASLALVVALIVLLLTICALSL